MLKGTGVSSGIGIAPALQYVPAAAFQEKRVPGDTASELELWKKAHAQAIIENQALSKRASKIASEAEAEIFEAHIALLEDEFSVDQPIRDEILSGMSVEEAVSKQFTELADMMESLGDEVFSARAADFRDLQEQLLRILTGAQKMDLSQLAEDVILVARDLTPSDTIQLDLQHIRGLLCEEGGRTSHTAILAKAVGLPAVVGCTGALNAIHDGDMLILDGSTGEVRPCPNQEELAFYYAKLVEENAFKSQLAAYVDKETITRDGHKTHICANIALPEECADAMQKGAEGIGLFRSECLYMGRTELPTEEEQFLAYKKTLELAQGRQVTVRTLDAGGDKELDMLNLPHEDNPFLGYRAIRICLDRPELLKTQLRALYRASIYGNLRIMFPMISSLEELRRAKEIAKEVRDQLSAEGIRYDPNVPLGLMVEIPAVAVTADSFAKEADFFSIGTNDLVQYSVAVDRGNHMIEHLYSYFHPAVVWMIQHTIEAAHRNRIPCCMCGEAAGDMEYIPALLGLGLDEFSMSAPSILPARKLISELAYEDCRNGSMHLSSLATKQEVADAVALLHPHNRTD